MKKGLLKLFAMLSLLFVFGYVAVRADNQKVPPEIGLRITRIQLDASRIQTQLIQLQQQYATDQQTLQKDQGEIDELKKEALTAGKLDPAGWDVDVEKLEFVAKPKAEVKK